MPCRCQWSWGDAHRLAEGIACILALQGCVSDRTSPRPEGPSTGSDKSQPSTGSAGEILAALQHVKEVLNNPTLTLNLDAPENASAKLGTRQRDPDPPHGRHGGWVAMVAKDEMYEKVEVTLAVESCAAPALPTTTRPQPLGASTQALHPPPSQPPLCVLSATRTAVSAAPR